MKRIIFSFVCITILLNAAGQNIFNGGNGDGWTVSTYADPVTNIFNGGNGDGWAVATILVNLPVRFLSFSGEKQGNAMLLKWATSYEQGADRFEVEHSTDGVVFVKTGNVAASNTSSNSQYSFTHNNPGSGMNYYRLKQVDKNGNFIYTNVVAVSFIQNEKEGNIYPQPAREVVTVELPQALQGEKTVINIINSTGVVVRQFHVQRQAATVTLPLGSLNKGVYILHLKGEQISNFHKLIVQ